MITNMKDYDDKFGGCIKNGKRYYYYNRSLQLYPYSKVDLFQKTQECLKYSEEMLAF
jgi:hypothetical protein